MSKWRIRKDGSWRLIDKASHVFSTSWNPYSFPPIKAVALLGVDMNYFEIEWKEDLECPDCGAGGWFDSNIIRTDFEGYCPTCGAFHEGAEV